MQPDKGLGAGRRGRAVDAHACVDARVLQGGMGREARRQWQAKVPLRLLRPPAACCHAVLQRRCKGQGPVPKLDLRHHMCQSIMAAAAPAGGVCVARGRMAGRLRKCRWDLPGGLEELVPHGRLGRDGDTSRVVQD